MTILLGMITACVGALTRDYFSLGTGLSASSAGVCFATLVWSPARAEARAEAARAEAARTEAARGEAARGAPPAPPIVSTIAPAGDEIAPDVKQPVYRV